MKKCFVTAIFVFWTCLGYAQSKNVILSTTLGDIKIMLYDDTPKHRDSFLKLAKEGHYDGTLFYRVVKDFVIQGGSSDSKNAAPGKHIGYGSSKLTIDSEFRENRFHKKGAICAPRQPEDINHFLMSDISQFYIVQGRVYTNKELDLLEKATNNPIMIKLKKEFYLPHKEKLKKLKADDPHEFNRLLREIKEKIAFEYALSNKLEFSPEQREVYTSIGGLPELDGEYTVFGEVISGFNVMEQIAALKTDKNNRPLKDVKLVLRLL
ncbi:peptidylprolyl isomerase/peptidyl-prolyl cis-trans isomerase B (cyclophilin B) [Saccharicrinis carchari]|uniref:peptidylprolyl isomerase n=1 Tax=Saccharicrinis carchari TaxID=1168039 RepID=A0A521EFK4_SACCC|nr:peptidylprolyl isomerase [Saccharicrinis carchari]SMO82707.1 peptidylprolyl isomerase/peptidyl-prolyl cis-trans isomerase B (cyclophilin B) [Saccharicrinis carchari]